MFVILFQMGPFSVKRAAGNGHNLFHSLATLLENVSFYFILSILLSTQNQCYVVTSKITNPLEVNGHLH
jgi:hypothetical protein